MAGGVYNKNRIFFCYFFLYRKRDQNVYHLCYVAFNFNFEDLPKNYLVNLIFFFDNQQLLSQHFIFKVNQKSIRYIDSSTAF